MQIQLFLADPDPEPGPQRRQLGGVVVGAQRENVPSDGPADRELNRI